ncbi:hypothetical protein [Parvicella tangerina]|uniref:Lipoprotein n=1 Tax=Parvicella tangerina TaxID=2829795 RepID=A0A916JLI5_9FLAO|nr:hypothetical protein [Parvicella tangerina]CAG5077869.1 hypothetical protein CRYO30217_00503 [Parvicella tangerina]
MKKQLTLIVLAAFTFGMVSCGGGEEESAEKEGKEGTTTTETNVEETVEEVAPTFEDVCTAATDIFLQVENYEYDLTEPFTHNGAFEVKRSQWSVLTDSTAELKLYNYDLGEDTGNNLDIYVKLNAKNGNVLAPAMYPYQDWENDYWAKVNIISPQGTVWFNWVSGMPEQGNVQIDYVDKDHVCGKFMLEVNQPDNTTVGHVVLNGSFNY